MYHYLDIVDDKLVEAIWQQISGLPVGAIANARHQIETFEPTTHTVVDTLWLAPVTLQCVCVCVCGNTH